MSKITPGRRAIVVGMMLLIAAIHILGVGRYLQGNLFSLYTSYFSDLILPFGCYFLLGMTEPQIPQLRHWQVKWLAAFLAPAGAETCQAFGLPVLGATFDPLDYIMYAAGTLLAVLVDRQVFSRIFSFWNMDRAVK